MCIPPQVGALIDAYLTEETCVAMLWNGARFSELSGLLCLRSVVVTKEPRVPHSRSPTCSAAGTNDIFAKVFEANGLVGVPFLRYNRYRDALWGVTAVLCSFHRTVSRRFCVLSPEPGRPRARSLRGRKAPVR